MDPTDLKPGVIIRGPVIPEPIQVVLSDPHGGIDPDHGQGPGNRPVPRPHPQHGTDRASDGQRPTRSRSTATPSASGWASRPCAWGSPTSTTPTSRLSIARVDPLPHQLEAVYDYFLQLPRIRFLLADDPGAGKTIMAGLLIKELKIRGLVKRTLIVTPANLTFQWQRELKDKFRENFEVIRGDVAPRQLRLEPLAGARTRSSPRSPGSRASRTPRKACSAATGT